MDIQQQINNQQTANSCDPDKCIYQYRVRELTAKDRGYPFHKASVDVYCLTHDRYLSRMEELLFELRKRR